MRLNLVLLLAVLLSALYLVHVQYQSRQLFFELEKVNAAAQRLEVEQSRLQVERRAEATSLRVESLASQRLQMRAATPAITQYVRADGSPIPVPSSAAQIALRPSGGAPPRGRQP